MVKNLPNSTSTKRHASFKSSHHKRIISLFQEESMKPHTKATAATAAKWALGLSAGFILGPIVVGLASETELSGGLIAEKLIVGIALIPILFFGLSVWEAISKKGPVAGTAIETNKGTTETPVAIQKTGAIVIRWTILMVAFLFAALLYGISKEIFPPSALTGGIRGISLFIRLKK